MIILASCDGTVNSDNQGAIEETEEKPKVTYEVMMYDNSGNNYVTFKGNKFNITPNRVKQYGYSSDGKWTWWYETSSVMSIEIDGSYVQSCGSTVIFKDSQLEMDVLNSIGTIDTSDGSGYSVNVSGEDFKTYAGLKNWWLDFREKGQGDSKAVLIQSQDGYNIGVIKGDKVKWEVLEDLPKTTLITIDDKPLYIHRCNFTIIDAKLLDKIV